MQNRTCQISVFVEDVALVLDECAIMLNPGASSRRPEVASVEKALAPYREIFRIQPPGTVDGGDILTVGQAVYVGISSRSTEDAIGQMKAILEPMQQLPGPCGARDGLSASQVGGHTGQ